MGKVKRDKSVPQSFKQKNRKNKKNKTVLSFDEAARNTWLTGFSKRKNERKKRAAKDEIERLKEEKRRIKQEKRDERKKHLEELRAAVGGGDLVPEMETIAKPQVYDMSTHTVTVVDVTNTDFIGNSGTRLGFNSVGEEEEEEEEEEPVTNQTTESGSEEEDDQKEDGTTTTKRKSYTIKRKKGRPKKNLTHLMEKRTMAKRARKFRDDRGKKIKTRKTTGKKKH